MRAAAQGCQGSGIATRMRKECKSAFEPKRQNNNRKAPLKGGPAGSVSNATHKHTHRHTYTHAHTHTHTHTHTRRPSNEKPEGKQRRPWLFATTLSRRRQHCCRTKKRLREEPPGRSTRGLEKEREAARARSHQRAKGDGRERERVSRVGGVVYRPAASSKSAAALLWRFCCWWMRARSAASCARVADMASLCHKARR